ncbi:hypothetical protein ASC75_19560 [Aminobacter sp. DSM 101952]|jgi:hypothetical protein|uniref:DUF3846 domain-containing protein n=1 Tax=Brucella anthropi TaxID=529 RepID=A0A8I0T9Z3_BRUAN|nr:MULTISPECIES: DUF3846 domain-containing protein [Hyphomicrobiales]KQU75072.1 hypothetical protein ASC75_19560 [Aminobacter sp. DSM 101952]MBE0562587.1 DUF3846 domain-containing protein [Brucella anthropi]MBP8936922.1 DUF3846 domain-containing protein [Agrobacterium sp.]TQN58236.1 DUF3846 domain-containing protein [Agrobacterium tumefaciens]
MTLNAYLVEVETRSIRMVTIDPANSLADIRRHIGCNLIDMVRIDRNHCIIVDDNGLMDEIPCFTEVADYASPLAGNLLIVGTDQFGETVSPQRPIEDFAGILTIRFPVLSPTFETISGPHVFGSRVSGFTATLKAANPAVIATA